MNSVNLLGRLTREPELRVTPSGQKRCFFTLAVDKGLNRQKRQEFESQGKATADFINCSAWGIRAETICNYVHKGDMIGVSGRLSAGSQKQGNTWVNYWTVEVENFDFTSSRSGAESHNQNQGFHSGGFNAAGSRNMDQTDPHNVPFPNDPYNNDPVKGADFGLDDDFSDDFDMEDDNVPF